MKTNFYTQCNSVKTSPGVNSSSENYQSLSISPDDSRCSSDPTGFSSAASAATRASANVSFKACTPAFSEKDVNIAVTLCGYSNIKGNSRDVCDVRCLLSYGETFPNSPRLFYNKNGDERSNGKSTMIIFPLDVNSNGYRGNDNMAMMINGHIPSQVASKLVSYLAKIGVLNANTSGNRHYFVDSVDPCRFMSNPKIKTLVAQFLTKAMKEYEIEQQQTPQSQVVNEKPAASSTSSASASSVEETNNTQNSRSTQNASSKPIKELKKVTASSINIVSPGRKQNPDNSREIDDYKKFFLDNNKQFTILHHGYNDNGVIKDMTVLLIPSVKEKGDFITVTIDEKLLSFDEAKNLVNYLVKSKVANPNNPNFRDTIVMYFSDK